MQKYILIRTNNFGVYTYVFQTSIEFKSLNPEDVIEKLNIGYDRYNLSRGTETLLIIFFPEISNNSIIPTIK